MRGLIIVLLLLLARCILAAVTDGTIILGMSLTTSESPNTLAHQGTKILNGLKLWIDVINSTSKEIRGQKYRFELKILEDDGSINQIMDNYQRLMNDTNVDYLLAPVGSLASNPISVFTNANQRLLVGTSVASVEFYSNKDFSFSVVPASIRCPTISFPHFRLRGDSKVALIVSQETDPREACEGMTNKEAAAHGLEIVARYQINSSLGNISDYAQEQIVESVKDLKQKQVDTIIGCAFGDTGELILKEFARQDYSPHFITFLPFNDQYSEIDNSLNDFVTGCSRFDAGANFGADPIFGSTPQFVQLYQNMYGSLPDDYAAFGAMAGLVYQTAIERANSFSQVDVRDTMERLNLDTFMGQFFFGSDHGNQLSCIFVQIVNGTRKVISPPLAQPASFDVIHPFPTWQERTFVRTFNEYTSEYVFFSIAMLGNLSSIALLVYVVACRHYPIIKASSPNLLIIFLIGSMFLYSSILTWSLSNVTPESCYLQSWFLSFGWTAMFGALFAKSWRVYKLSNNNSLQIFKITDAQLVLLIAGLLVGNIIVCAVQAGVIDMNPIRIQVDQYRPVNDYEVCSMSGSIIGIAAALIAYNGSLGIFGLIIAWKIRKLQYSLYNESKIIAFSMYNAAFFAILVITLQFTQATERELLYILRSAGIVLGTVVSVATLFVTKLTMSRKKHSSSFKTSSNSNSSKHNTNYAFTDQQRVELQKRVEHQEEEIKSLKSNNKNTQYYQQKYENLYHENQLLKNQIFQLQTSAQSTNVPDQPNNNCHSNNNNE